MKSMPANLCIVISTVNTYKFKQKYRMFPPWLAANETLADNTVGRNDFADLFYFRDKVNWGLPSTRALMKIDGLSVKHDPRTGVLRPKARESDPARSWRKVTGREGEGGGMTCIVGEAANYGLYCSAQMRAGKYSMYVICVLNRTSCT